MTSQHTYQVGFADALTKLSWGIATWRTGTPALSNTLCVQGARGEVVGCQVHLGSDQEFVLVVDQTNWLHPLGFIPRVRLSVRFNELPDDAVEVFPVGWVEGDDRRQWMEYLDRAGTVEVPAQRPQAAYLRIRIPPEIQPGEYFGTVEVYAQEGFGDEQLVWAGKVTLEVSAVTLPPVQAYSFHLNLWQHLTSLSRYYRVPLWSDDHFKIIDRYFASLAQLGQKAVSLVVTEIPWSGQRCYRDRAYPSYLFEHAVVGVSRALDGTLMMDFTPMDRVLALAGKYGMDREINVIGLLNIWVDEEYGFGKIVVDAPDAVRVRCFDESSRSFTYLRTAADLQFFIRALHDHMGELSVLDRVRVTADEPANLENFKRSLAFIQQAGPGFQYSAAINHFEFLEEAPPEVLDFTPILPLACQDPTFTSRLAETLHENGGRMFWYVCCWPPIPNTFVHSPLVEARLHGWLNKALNLDGFLRWAFCLWPADPWRRVSWRAPQWYAGDMYFVLPGNDGAPVETLRYEALRMAVQDFELLELAERTLPAETFQNVYSRANECIFRTKDLGDFASVGTAQAENLYSLDPADYHSARRIIFESLQPYF